jgi:hypothetical protein
VKPFFIAVMCLASSLPGLAQAANEPASRDEIILYLRTMRSHDMLQRTMEVQSQTMRQLLHDQLLNEKGKLPPDFDAHMKRAMDDLIKNLPSDEIIQAMIPAYEKHFTKGDIEAMNAFYSSPVGQKVLEQLPAVLQEGNQAAMPIMNKYLTEWRERMKNDLESEPSASPAKTGGAAPSAPK